MKSLQSAFGILCIAIAFTAISGNARATTITFDEISPLSTHSLYLKGVLFNYSGSFSTFGDTAGPSQPMAYISQPWLTGEAHGALTMTFDSAVTSLSFGYALNTEPHVGVLKAITVNAFGLDAKVLSTLTQDAPAVLWTAEGLYSQTYVTPVKQVQITFNSAFPFHGFDPLFGIDNVTFSSASPVPEPATYGIVSTSCLLGLIIIRRRRQKMRVESRFRESA